MIQITLDGVQGIEAIHDQLAEVLQFPAHYGRNLDALYDCLTEVQEDVQISLVNMEILGRRGRSLQALLLDASIANPHIHP